MVSEDWNGGVAPWPVYVFLAPPWKIGIMRNRWFFKASKLDQVTQCTIVVTLPAWSSHHWTPQEFLQLLVWPTTWIHDLNTARMTYPSSLPFLASPLYTGIQLDKTMPNPRWKARIRASVPKKVPETCKNTHTHTCGRISCILSGTCIMISDSFWGGLELRRQHLNSAAAALRSVQSWEVLRFKIFKLKCAWSSNILQFFNAFAQSFRFWRNFAALYWICFLDCWFAGKP